MGRLPLQQGLVALSSKKSIVGNNSAKLGYPTLLSNNRFRLLDQDSGSGFAKGSSPLFSNSSSNFRKQKYLPNPNPNSNAYFSRPRGSIGGKLVANKTGHFSRTKSYFSVISLLGQIRLLSKFGV